MEARSEHLAEPADGAGYAWYILFNVIAGASAFPTDLREASDRCMPAQVAWWRKVFFPHLSYYVTGR